MLLSIESDLYPPPKPKYSPWLSSFEYPEDLDSNVAARNRLIVTVYDDVFTQQN